MVPVIEIRSILSLNKIKPAIYINGMLTKPSEPAIVILVYLNPTVMNNWANKLKNPIKVKVSIELTEFGNINSGMLGNINIVVLIRKKTYMIDMESWSSLSFLISIITIPKHKDAVKDRRSAFSNEKMFSGLRIKNIPINEVAIAVNVHLEGRSFRKIIDIILDHTTHNWKMIFIFPGPDSVNAL